MKKFLIVLLILAIIGGGGYGAYYFFFASNELDEEEIKNGWHIEVVNDYINKNKDIMKYIGKEAGIDVAFMIASLDNQIKAHDLSKFSVEEWEPYRKNFYPVNEEEKENNIADYQKAWKHHYMVNLHHWDYWHNTDSVDKMSIEFVLEMCCDWIAMSMRFGGTAYKWYIDNKKDIVLGDKQTDWVTNILKIYYNIK